MALIDSTANQFLGTGYIFPIQLTSAGRPDIKGGTELLESSIANILSTTIGTRFFLGEYGTNLEQLLQEPNDIKTQILVKHFTVDVISKWEKRIEVLEVTLEAKNDYTLYIRIKYQLVNTTLQSSFIFPYYSTILY